MTYFLEPYLNFFAEPFTIIIYHQSQICLCLKRLYLFPLASIFSYILLLNTCVVYFPLSFSSTLQIRYFTGLGRRAAVSAWAGWKSAQPWPPRRLHLLFTTTPTDSPENSEATLMTLIFRECSTSRRDGRRQEKKGRKIARTWKSFLWDFSSPRRQCQPKEFC